MGTLWLEEQAVLPARADAVVWHALDGGLVRAYCEADAAPGTGWLALHALQVLAGASAGQHASHHYVVEVDVEPADEAEFNAWYVQEHLPGLAAVPGTVRAARYRCDARSPRYLACYDLTSPAALERPQWLAVRHTAWSARVRPMFRNTRRTMFSRDQQLRFPPGSTPMMPVNVR